MQDKAVVLTFVICDILLPVEKILRDKVFYVTINIRKDDLFNEPISEMARRKIRRDK
jgi:hypothetical protein